MVSELQDCKHLFVSDHLAGAPFMLPHGHAALGFPAQVPMASSAHHAALIQQQQALAAHAAAAAQQGEFLVALFACRVLSSSHSFIYITTIF